MTSWRRAVGSDGPTRSYCVKTKNLSARVGCACAAFPHLEFDNTDLLKEISKCVQLCMTLETQYLLENRMDQYEILVRGISHDCRSTLEGEGVLYTSICGARFVRKRNPERKSQARQSAATSVAIKKESQLTRAIIAFNTNRRAARAPAHLSRLAGHPPRAHLARAPRSCRPGPAGLYAGRMLHNDTIGRFV
ncbi:hypothetical protein EVAR_36286_1 [Eumeta japonica]|uniref:Uncharacterized protein n=1 Tax=Eumeta variegata TaxID=151549 RepID=A0A4C1VKE0_EUMVA|nr:hypothetical protein EVAR_36286_1 [Eumeta japonica]